MDSFLKVNIDLWILITCIVACFLSLITTAVVIFKKKSRVPYGCRLSAGQKDETTFENEVNYQVSCQRLDCLMMNTINEIEKQRQYLQGHMQQGNSSYSKTTNLLHFNKKLSTKQIKNTVKHDTARKKDNHYKLNQVNPPDLSTHDTNYSRISDLFQKGMNSQQVAKKLQIPQSEIDLYVKLHLGQKNTI